MNEPINPTSMETMPPASQAYILAAEQRSLDFLNPKLWQAITVAARAFFDSGALPTSMDNTGKVIMAMQAGYELGLQPVEALQSFYYVNGKLAIYGEIVIARAFQAGHNVEWGECNSETATVTVTNGKTGTKMTQTLTMKMVRERKIDQGRNGTKDVWIKFPENMLKFRVFGMVSRFVIPDIFHRLPPMDAEVEDDMDEYVAAVNKAPAQVGAQLAASGRPSLEAALNAPEPPKEDATPVKAKKSKKEVVEELPVAEETEEEASVPVPEEKTPEPIESPEERYNRLINEELEGRKLTPREAMEVNAYKATKGE